MAFLGRHLHMQPSEFGALSNDRTRLLVAATQRILDGEAKERWEMLRIQVQATIGKTI